MSSTGRQGQASPLEPDLGREGHGDITGKPKAGAAGARARTDEAANIAGTTQRTGAMASETLTDQAEGEIRVPVAEERLAVGKREAELGEVQVRKTVTEEQQTVPVTLQREEVHVEERDVADRPLRGGRGRLQRGHDPRPGARRGGRGRQGGRRHRRGGDRQGRGRPSSARSATPCASSAWMSTRTTSRRAPASSRSSPRARIAATAPSRRPSRTTAPASPPRTTSATPGRQFEDAEPELRREYETRATGTTGGGDSWEQLREEVRSGWNRARNS